MSTRRNTKFNKNNGYKDFTFTKNKIKNDDYIEIKNSVNIPDYNLPMKKD